jgi:hypothetical protein
MADIKAIEAEAMALPPAQRAQLAQHLLSSLDELDEEENERLWLEEAERRYQGYRKGTISSNDAFEAIAEARSSLK